MRNDVTCYDNCSCHEYDNIMLDSFLKNVQLISIKIYINILPVLRKLMKRYIYICSIVAIRAKYV